ncbi:MAG: phosphodiesterase [Prevotellaceae bacterium]|jgi:(p)ppGpp synthase/HD superfamily hydrolase|nr:phosphodiesterase [Prevotellaceae bacterium]
MNKETFILITQRYQSWINEMEKTGCALHHQTNQEYDEDLPYGFHLKLVASFVTKYGYLVAGNEPDVLILYAAAYLHDSIEDARLSYNDVVKLLKKLNEKVLLPEGNIRTSVETFTPEIVYALTNEKGRTRAERANDRYYEGIRKTRFAPFVKMCDRMANIRYGTLFAGKSRMFDIYRKEHRHFIDAIGKGALTPVPREMEADLLQMLSEDTNAVKL